MFRGSGGVLSEITGFELKISSLDVSDAMGIGELEVTAVQLNLERQLGHEIEHECDDRIDGNQLNAFEPI